MTTYTNAAVMDHTTDAAFRTWGSYLAAALATVGLVQTTDTGQINWTTVTRAGTNANAGYEIWKFNDSYQATAPIFIRFDYGTGSTTASGRLQVTVGTSTNGAGTMTGTTTTALTVSRGVTGSTVLAYTTYMSGAAGFFGMVFKTGSVSTSLPFSVVTVSRSCDANGTPTTTGAFCYFGQGNTGAPNGCIGQVLVFTPTPAVRSTTQVYCLMTESVSNSLVSGDLQAFPFFGLFPRNTPIFSHCGIVLSELPIGTTFVTAMVGTATRTFISMGGGTSILNAADAGGSSTHATGMLWE